MMLPKNSSIVYFYTHDVLRDGGFVPTLAWCESDNPQRLTMQDAWERARVEYEYEVCRKRNPQVVGITLVLASGEERQLMEKSVLSIASQLSVQRLWMSFRRNPSLRNLEITLALLEDEGIGKGMIAYEEFCKYAVGFINGA